MPSNPLDALDNPLDPAAAGSGGDSGSGSGSGSTATYTTAARVEVRISTLGAELRTDADPGGGMGEAIENASADIEFYTGGRYLPADLPGSRWVGKIATDLAVFYLCELRLGPVPEAAQAAYDRAIEALTLVKNGMWFIPGLPQGRSSAPSVTNYSVDMQAMPSVRVERPRSTGKADGYRRRIDYTSDYLDRG